MGLVCCIKKISGEQKFSINFPLSDQLKLTSMNEGVVQTQLLQVLCFDLIKNENVNKVHSTKAHIYTASSLDRIDMHTKRFTVFSSLNCNRMGTMYQHEIYIL